MIKQNYKRLEDIVKMSKINLDNLTMQQQQLGTTYTGQTSSDNNIGGWNGYDYSVDFSTLEKWLESGKLDHEKDLIDLVGKMIMERLDQLLDEDTDKLVRILVENKLFKDENTGLRKEITELKSRIDELEARLSVVEGLSYRFREKLNHYDNSYRYGTLEPLLTTSNTITNDAVSSISSMTTTNDKPSMMDRLAKLFGSDTQPTA